MDEMAEVVDFADSTVRDSSDAIDERGNVGRGGSADGSSSEPSDFSMVPLGWLAAGTFVVGLILYGIQQALKLPAGYGIEDLLGWKTSAVISAAISNWCPEISMRWRGAVVYMLSDTALFMPFYGALILATSRGLGGALHPEPAPLARLLKAALQPATWILVSALWAVDGLENLGGALRLGIPVWIFALSLVVGALLFVVFWRTVLADERTRERLACRNAFYLLLAVLAVALLSFAPSLAAGCEAAALHPGDYALAWAHHAKPWFILLALSPIAFGSLTWWFGADLDLLNGGQQLVAEQRAAWRAGVTGVIGRTRYVLLLLILFATFTLVLDQCRDVLLSLAGPRGQEADRTYLALAWRVLVLLLGAISVAMLAYSSWLWTRLAGMVQRPGLALPGGHLVYDRVGEFARGWARAVSMLPLLIVCILLAHTAGDAASAAAAARSGPASDSLPMTLLYLFLFGALAIVGGYAFLQVRRGLPLPLLSDYYNSDPDVLGLLRDGTLLRRAAKTKETSVIDEKSWCRKLRLILAPVTKTLKPAFVRLTTPVTRPVLLPLVSLALMLVLRAGMAWDPSTTAQAPATLALLGLSLSWWMGIAGAMSMVEQRQTVPWGLVTICIVGLFGLVVDNHVLPLHTFRVLPLDNALETLRFSGFLVTTLLAALGTAWWLAATFSRAPSPLAPRRPLGLQTSWKPRIGVALAAFVVALLGLFAVDRSTSTVFADPAPLGEVRTMDDAMKKWEAPGNPTDGDNRIYLVASEGGGIRSAYWTARVLAELHDKNEKSHFDGRTVVLSGVSGGAIGEAVYRACLRNEAQLAPKRVPAVECVQQKFAKLDPLSPLIGGFMFEDVFARVLPVHFGHGWSICEQPGCGFLSRALGFEHEWIRQFPALAEPIGRWIPGEPELMLNSTWVETGNRIVFSTMKLSSSQIPASVDALQRLGAQPSLMASAHSAARFPFINPLAAVRPASGASDAGTAVGHLADGGYHENSGAESLTDVWHVLRTKLPPTWRVQLILIRNGQTKPGCEKHAHQEPLKDCLVSTLPKPADLAAAVDRPLLNLYADLFGPAVAVVNVSGIGAHGRQSPAALDVDIGTSLVKFGEPAPTPLRPCLLDQSTEATLVPLGWYLSAAAREAMDAQVHRALSQADCFPGVESP